MKKSLIILVVLIAALSSQAQTSKGSMFVGGDFRYYHNTNKNENLKADRYYHFEISPHFGYFITDRFALGISAKYSIVKGSYDTLTSEYLSTNKRYGPDLIARYYGSIAGNFGYFVQGDVGYQFHEHNYSNELPDKGNTISIGLKPGLYYFITPKICLETTLGRISYEMDVTKNDVSGTESNSNSFNLNAGLSSIYLGLNIYF